MLSSDLQNGGSASPKVIFADRLRAIAALSVVISHYLSVLWYMPDAVIDLLKINPYHFETPTFVTLLQIPHFNWGGFGVAIFFVISGFVIPFSFQKNTATQFLIGRFFRIYPTYWCGLIFSLLALLFISSIQGSSFPRNVTDISMAFLVGLRDVFRWDHPAMDGVVWTLEIEVKFYLILFFAATWLRKYSLKVFLIPLLIFAAVLVTARIPALRGDYSYWIGLSGPHLIYMFTGTALHYCFVKKLSIKNAALLVIFLFALYGVATNNGAVRATRLIPTFAIALAFFAAIQRWPTFINRLNFLTFWSDISYPLYAVHQIAGYAAIILLMERGVAWYLAIPFTFAIIVAISTFLHRKVEIPTRDILRRKRQDRPKTSEPAIFADTSA